jgi:flagellar hook-basal body complex protein FliE
MSSPITAASAYSATQRLASPTAGFSAGGGIGGVAAPDAGGTSFGQMLGDVLKTVAETGQRADQQSAAAMQGKADMVDIVTAVAESESAIETLVAVRDRMVAAYEEIMRMQI